MIIHPELDTRPIDQLSHAEKAFRREENTIVGFGPGMAASLLGNTARRSKHLRIQPPGLAKFGYEAIGWSAEYHTKNEPVFRVPRPSAPFTSTFDYGQVKNTP